MKSPTKITITQLECLRCGHRWFPSGNGTEKPRCCGWCKSAYWNIKPSVVSKTRKKHERECKNCKAEKKS